MDKTLCSCWCQNSGPITFNMSIPVTGFTPGQEVNVGAYVENMSNISAESVKFQIFQVCICLISSCVEFYIYLLP